MGQISKMVFVIKVVVHRGVISLMRTKIEQVVFWGAIEGAFNSKKKVYKTANATRTEPSHLYVIVSHQVKNNNILVVATLSRGRERGVFYPCGQGWIPLRA